MSIITTENFSASYDGKKMVLDDLNFSIDAGEIFIIAGPSGCGKSTLLQHLIGLVTPYQGKVTIMGNNITESTEDERINLLKNIGVTFQSCALFGSMTLLDNVCLALEEWTPLPRAIIEQIASHKLSLVGLGEYKNYLPHNISGGMQKRAAIARAMALDPKILVLDEPSAGLDPITSHELNQLILQLNKNLGITFVIVSHEIGSIFSIANRVLLLRDGQIAELDSPINLLNGPDEFVKQFFNAGMVNIAHE